MMAVGEEASTAGYRAFKAGYDAAAALGPKQWSCADVEYQRWRNTVQGPPAPFVEDAHVMDLWKGKTDAG